MCGFVCIVRKNKDSKTSNLDQIPNDLLSHRGPDFTSEVQYENISIRHWRLSIVDLTESSNQPIVDEKYIFVYNGEVYDYKKIIKQSGIDINSDTLAVRSLVDSTKGMNQLYSSPGFFSFLLISKEKKTVFGSRDIFGKKPLFYFIDDDVAIFSSEERGIFPFVGEKKINKDSLKEYFLYKDTFNGKSFFNGIQEIPPGSNFLFDKKSWSIKFSDSWENYYKRDFSENFSNIFPTSYFDKEDINFSLEKNLEEAIDRRLSCDVPVQIGLSGGIDSTLVAILAAKSNFSDNINKAINVSFLDGIDESHEAKKTSRSLNLNFTKINFEISNFIEMMKFAVKNFNGPLSHPHSLAVLEMCKEVRKSGKVLLTGEGADELFFGYNQYNNFNDNSFAFREYLTPLEEKSFTHKTRSIKNAFDEIRKDSILELGKKANKSEYNSRDLEIKTHLISLLKRNDRMGMAHSVEIRCPFLDHNIFKFIYNMDQDKLLSEKKNYLRKAVYKLYPELSYERKKLGFIVPYDKNYLEIIQHYEGKRWVENAIDYIRDNFKISLIDKKSLTPRISWTMLNIGCFLDNI